MLDRKSQRGRELREPPADTQPARRTRADRALETRRKLIDAAAKVVGAEGYANASVARITARADIAQGTFYNYFDSQQDLFDHLLPELGGELLDFIRARIAGETDSFKREAIGFRAYFDFLAERPEFYRILNEAETFAPKAFQDHMRNMAEGYVRALGRSHGKGELAAFERRELEVIVYVLLAARNYLSFRYLYRDGQARHLPQWVDRAYLKFLAGGFGRHAGRSTRRSGQGGRRLAANAHTVLDPSQAQMTVRAAGEVRIELDLSQAGTHDGDAPSQSLLLGMIEMAAAAAVGTLSAAPACMLSLSTSFLSTASGTRLIALAHAVPSENAIHVAVSVGELTSAATAVATAQAVYAVVQGNDANRQQDES